MSQIKIALTGQMRSGKDTVAKYLMDHHYFFSYAFGDALKHYAHHIFFDVPEEPKPRDLYQFMNVMREYDKDVWVKHVERNIRTLEQIVPNYNGIVITDVRQENEYQWCKDNGFTIVKVSSKLQNRLHRMEQMGEHVEQSQLQHTTESAAVRLKADYTLNNDSAIEHLYTQVERLLLKLANEES